MTTQQLLTTIADGLSIAVRDGWPRTHVCLFDCKLQVLRTTHTTKRHPIFATYTHTDLIQGLTHQQWHRLIVKLLPYFKDHNQCTQTPQHSHQQIATFLLTHSRTPKAPPPNNEKA